MRSIVTRAVPVALIVAAVCAAPVFAQQTSASAPTADERAVAAFIQAHNADGLALLEKAVDINSGTENLAGVRKVGDLFKAEFDALGFSTTWVDGAAWGHAGHLVATHPGPGRKILLIGHLDTVFAADSPFQKMTRVDAKMAGGPGIIDMKGGDVIIVQALKALQSVGALKSMNIVVVMTGDEEAPGRPLSVARQALVDAAKGAAVAIGFEDGDGDPAHAVVARRGSTSWKLTVTGTPAHSSQIFTDAIGPGAIFEASRILNAFREQLGHEEHLTFSPGLILGGTTADLDAPQAKGAAFGKTNVVAEHAIVTGDLRALTVAQFEHAKQTMQQIVAASLPHTRAEIVFDDGYPPLAPTDGNAKLLAIYSQASQDMDLGRVDAVSPDKAGAADVSFVASEVPMIIDAVGLKGHDDHTVGETADLSTLPIQTIRAAVTLLRLR
jgi:glutamate carboxypeptidase